MEPSNETLEEKIGRILAVLDVPIQIVKEKSRKNDAIVTFFLRKLVDANPKTAYEAFREAGDKKGLSLARGKLVDADPEKAYEAFGEAGDKEGLSLLGRKLVDADPEKAYWAFREAGDKEGLQMLASHLEEKNKLPKGILESFLI